jgi:hypothetical protein
MAFMMGVYSERCARGPKDLRRAVPGAKPFCTLKRGKRCRKFEKSMKDQNGVCVPGESVR